jgi:queuine tRNA-ribosyltransferase
MQTDDNYKPQFSFTIYHKDKNSKARVGKIITPHGEIDTPQFVPVGTQATVKTLSPEELKEVNAQIIFGNTYHLHLRPGEEVISHLGGLAKFMSWNGPTITDSGGFQVFSLGRVVIPAQAGISSGERDPHLREDDRLDKEDSSALPQNDKELDTLVKITDDKVEFRSHLDGSKHVFTPEKSIEIQHKLGADFIVAFDQCPPNPATHEEAKRAMERTHAWLLRCIDYHKTHGDVTKQALVGIVQGGTYSDLRQESAKFVAAQELDFLAIGGVAVGETKEEMRQALTDVMPHLPEAKSKHLLGVGEVDDIFDIIEQGIDTFDCVIPTRFGRYGVVFAGKPDSDLEKKFRLDLTRTAYAGSSDPMVNGCACKVCTTYTKGYVHHLLKANEILAYRLASYHNVYFLVNLVKEIREAILEDRFAEMKREWLGR